MFRLYAVLILFMVASIGNAQVLISEFLAKNVTTNPDNVDFDDYSDWIEIFNNQNISASLDGYFLTDNLNDPLKWQIPSGIILQPHQSILFWADGFDSPPGKTYYRANWPWDSYVTKRYHTNFKLDFLGEEIGLFKSSQSLSTTLITAGDNWKYLDDGSDQSSNWISLSYNDSQWKTGKAQLGYGDGDETTIISFGNNSSGKFITSYFRKTIQINNPANIEKLVLNIVRDDGAVVYLNGSEIARSNMSSSQINYLSGAETSVSGSDESSFFTYDITPNNLVQGNNVIAVEVHQYNGQSSDLSFDLELTAINKTNNTLVELVDSVTFGRQINDVSMGRNPSDSFKWYYYGEPTPGRVNSTKPVLSTEKLNPVRFSLDGGFFNDVQSLELSSVDPEAEIRYTLDGSIPTSASFLFAEPITISQTTVVRSRAFSGNKLPGPVISNTYFLNESNSLPVASLIADPQTLWDDEIGIYKNNLKDRQIPLSIEYFNTDGAKQFKIDAGTKIGGYNIFRFAQKPLNIYLDSDYGTDQLTYRLFDGKKISVFNSFEFRNGGDNWPTTMLQDAMSESIVKGQMKNGIQAYKPCVVYINGEYWGIHNLREKFDKQYLVSNFNADPNNIEQIRYNLFPPNASLGIELVEGTMDEYNALIDFANKNDLSVPANYEYMKSKMDFDSIIDLVVTEAYVCNTSWRHNREWWHSTNEGGKWYWFIPDIDRGFNYQNISSNVLDNIVGEYTLFSRLLTNTEFKNYFIQRFAAHLNSTFLPDRINNIVDSLSSVVSNDMPRHIQRWQAEGGISSMSAWNNELNLIRKFANERDPIMFNQINSEFNLQNVARLSISFIDNEVNGKIIINGVPLTSAFNELQFFKGIPLRILVEPKAGYRFSGWEGYPAADELVLTLDGDKTITPLFEVSDEILIPSDISTDLILSSKDRPYTSKGDIVVEPYTTLSIGEGVTIQMAESAGIYVFGKLVIKGTESSPVKIIPRGGTGYEKWGAICFNGSTDTNIISHAVITGATTGKDVINQIAAISSINSNLIIDDILISDVKFPIFVKSGSVVLRNSTLFANNTCDYIGVKKGKALVENNTFWGNKAPDTDAIDYDGDVDGIIRGNRIFNFSGFNCDAIDIGEESQNILITGNYIFGSKDKGVSVGQQSSVVIEKNVIIGCDIGIAVKDKSHAIIKNNTFFMNNTAIASFEKIYGQGGGFAEVSNSIFSASKIQSVYADHLSTLSVSYCLSDMDYVEGNNNLFADSKFVDAANYNLALKPSSLCIDNGNPADSKDYDGTVIDIGAYYSYDEQDLPAAIRIPVKSQVVINEIMYNSGSAKNSDDWIELYNTSSADINLSGWKITDEDSTHIFLLPDHAGIGPNDFLVLCRDSVSFKEAYPQVENVVGNFEFGLGGKDKVLLFNQQDSLITFVAYGNELPWPVEPDGKGPSLELKRVFDINYRTSEWYASLGEGTPGQPNSNNPVSVNEIAELPSNFNLYQNYPNPFNPVSNIKYEILNTVPVNLTVYNMLGQQVLVLVDREQLPGYYNVEIDGSKLASGVYIYKLHAGSFVQTKKMILLK